MKMVRKGSAASRQQFCLTAKYNRLRLSLTAVLLAACFGVAADYLISPEPARAFNGKASATVVISEIYGGGGNAGATYTNDFVELLNVSSSAIDVSGWSIQYQSSAGTTWTVVNLCSSTTAGTCVIQPGHYYLVQLGSSSATGIALPTPDAPISSLNISGQQGKIALVNSRTALPTTSAGNCYSVLQTTGAPAVIDLVGYGTSTNPCFESTQAPGTSSNTTSIARSSFVDSDVNGTDFALTSPPTPLNSTATAITPTAANGEISGRVLKEDGTGLGGVVVSLNGSQTNRTITDSNGYYKFTEVETSGFYTVVPSRANYSFGPRERSFSSVSSRTEAVFTAVTAQQQTENPLETDLFFVRQQYLDFLGREPDTEGLKYWANEIDRCGTDADCLTQRRIGVSAAFFMEPEGQETGSFVYRLYRAGLGRRLSFAEFSTDRSQVVGGANLEASRAQFAEQFVNRAEFKAKYSAANSAESFVDALLSNIRATSGVDLSEQRGTLISKYQSASEMNQSRALVVREAVESEAFKAAEYNRAFVLMEYFGYLRREPEQAGFDFWLNVLNNREPGNYRGMVCSFITSTEYQERFSGYAVHSNSECSR